MIVQKGWKNINNLKYFGWFFSSTAVTSLLLLLCQFCKAGFFHILTMMYLMIYTELKDHGQKLSTSFVTHCSVDNMNNLLLIEV